MVNPPDAGLDHTRLLLNSIMAALEEKLKGCAIILVISPPKAEQSCYVSNVPRENACLVLKALVAKFEGRMHDRAYNQAVRTNTMQDYGPRTIAADTLHGLKYRAKGEDFREAMNRVAYGLRDSDEHYHQLRQILLHQRFCPGGRIQSAVGSSRIITALNCFASGTIADSFIEGYDSIMDRAKEAAATMRAGGGIGYDFSTLRPRGSLIRKLQSQSSGPVSFMHIFDAICRATSSSGHRRGAQMGVLRVDHPDIEEFIRAKQNATELLGFNISVGITNEFMEAVITGREFDLRFNGEVHSTISAPELWEKIMRSTWDYAEPGVLFLDTINGENNLYYCENIATTNPCAEQPLPPHGACLLGSFNLVKYLNTAEATYYFDFAQLRQDIPVIVRGLDNVIDRTKYPIPAQKLEAQAKRRLGIGVMGLANAIEALGHPYGSSSFLSMAEKILACIRDEAYLASVMLAKEKGPFPLYDERYTAGVFVRRLPKNIQAEIALHGIRNSHLTSIAPTGTISLCADNVSGGIEPVFAYTTERQIYTPEGITLARVDDYAYGFLGVKGKLASDVTAEEHLAVLAAAQRYVDSSVSKTINMDARMPWQNFKNIYLHAWENKCKGCATFNIDGKRSALLKAVEPETSSPVSCLIADPATGQRECA